MSRRLDQFEDLVSPTVDSSRNQRFGRIEPRKMTFSLSLFFRRVDSLFSVLCLTSMGKLYGESNSISVKRLLDKKRRFLDIATS